MPIEVSPIPFSDQQLPYTPKFVPQHMSNIVQAGGSVVSGPASVQANALIPPVPGGVATPHSAIPALPEAGYTAPTIRPAASLRGGAAPARLIRPAAAYPPDQGGHGAAYAPPPESVYAGGSMYARHAPAPSSAHGGGWYAPSVVSDGWASNSLPEPRRAPVQVAYEPEPDPYYGAPAREHEPDPYYRAHEHEHEHERAPQPASGPAPAPEPDSSRRRHRHRSADIDDGASDGSYYARPKSVRQGSEHGDDVHVHGRARSRSIKHTHAHAHHAHTHASPHRSPLVPQHTGERSPGPVPPPAMARASPAPEQRPRRPSASSAHPHSPARDAGDAEPHKHHHRSASLRLGPGAHPPQAHRNLYVAPTEPGHVAPALTRHRRRALSMHDAALAHFAPPGPAYTGQLEYDDGQSVAGSAMTFMDGTVGGRVSQYGLPKYPFKPKFDHRRFYVQRGNADVFLD
ncbi:tRNA (guanine-N(7)-)-methyltransferase (tRNA(m7G46)-methyltransferase) [Cryptotrichosporon argae]